MVPYAAPSPLLVVEPQITRLNVNHTLWLCPLPPIPDQFAYIWLTKCTSKASSLRMDGMRIELPSLLFRFCTVRGKFHSFMACGGAVFVISQNWEDIAKSHRRKGCSCNRPQLLLLFQCRINCSREWDGVEAERKRGGMSGVMESLCDPPPPFPRLFPCYSRTNNIHEMQMRRIERPDFARGNFHQPHCLLSPFCICGLRTSLNSHKRWH